MWRDFMDSTPGPEVGCGKVEVTDLEAAGIPSFKSMSRPPIAASKLGVGRRCRSH